jgi:rod shape-determining protein MreC
MSQKSTRFKIALICLVLLVLPLFSMYFHGRTERSQTPVETVVIGITAPGQKLVHAVFSNLVAAVKRYTYLVEVEAQNEELRAGIEELKLTAMKGRRLEEENQRLRAMLEFRDEQKGLALTAARVIARETSPVFSVSRVRLDRGADGKVPAAANMPVVTPEGVVGRVEKVAGDYCDVMLVTDSRSKMDVQVAGKGVSGLLVGTGDGLPVFRFPYQKARLSKGDVLITTGHDRLFPKGLVAGYLGSDESKQVGQQIEIPVEPAVRFPMLQEVFLVTNAQDAVPPEAVTGSWEVTR